MKTARIALAVVATLTLGSAAGCAGDEGNVKALCSLVNSDFSLDPLSDPAGTIAAFVALKAVAPKDLSKEYDKLISIVTSLRDIDPNDPAAAAEALQAATGDDFEALLTSIEQRQKELCG